MCGRRDTKASTEADDTVVKGALAAAAAATCGGGSVSGKQIIPAVPPPAARRLVGAATAEGGKPRRRKVKKTKKVTASQREEKAALAIAGKDPKRAEAARLGGQANAYAAIAEARAALKRAEPQLNSLIPTRSLWQLVGQKKPAALQKLIALKQAGAKRAMQAVQIRFLLTTTKPIIPLLMLVATGTAMNGIISSLIISQLLRSCVPNLRVSTVHILLIMFGFLHTLLGVQASQVAEHAESAGVDSVLSLEWHWQFRDVITIANIASIGSIFSSVSGLKNEPSFTASFAAGVALRMFVHDHAAEASTALLDAATVGFPIQFVALDDVVMRGGGGVGDCGGGPFRMLFGEWAFLVVECLRLFLLAIPLTAALQWLRRSVHELQKRGTRHWRWRKMLTCAGIGAAMALQVLVICCFSLNAVNGSLAGFFFTALFGCGLESLLSTYDVRGPTMSFLLVVILILV